MRAYDSGWFTSSRSAASSNACVEVRLTDRAVSVRDSKDPDGGDFTVDHRAWSAFLRYLTAPDVTG
ncbi:MULTISPECIES: DUF397 domain-containing protein [unclassified Saccharopolyspora]|uniref:DUF397 domain-containing protein n=1 Tax=unclassified Saccharopolyspora TaxID=2646250 RepID=UPI001CD630AE|nr:MULTISPECIES: DUF397 domain-containing protein [unclassified Saccharopolyspora]MCA1187481.1 DUF397 domain-containing protein [Saccharopolyspora sp. 6T]MCA1225868.1 DUF397 domain-containing protein [Saccharopolyspora sp. 6M]MCA1280602.1 DUF397 domain-containing protein [Saccharopolyspora sp. 7B]